MKAVLKENADYINYSPGALCSAVGQQDPMMDSDLLALLFPENDNARCCLRRPENSTRYVSFLDTDVAANSRDPTPAPESLGNIGVECLELRFGDPKAKEWTIGRASFCDIVLGRSEVSRQHCQIIPQPDGLYIKDVSSHGTAVAYDGEVPILQKSHMWRIAGKPGEPMLWDTLMLHIADVALRVVLPNHMAGDPTYIKNFEDSIHASQDDTTAMDGPDIISGRSTMLSGTPYLGPRYEAMPYLCEPSPSSQTPAKHPAMQPSDAVSKVRISFSSSVCLV